MGEDPALHRCAEGSGAHVFPFLADPEVLYDFDGNGQAAAAAAVDEAVTVVGNGQHIVAALDDSVEVAAFVYVVAVVPVFAAVPRRENVGGDDGTP